MRTSNFALRLQPTLLESARNLAESEGVALNQLINVAVAKMIGEHNAANYLSLRAQRANLPSALEILNKAGRGNPPMKGDELPASWNRLRALSARSPKKRPSTRNK
jgi:hypothetical protein